MEEWKSYRNAYGEIDILRFLEDRYDKPLDLDMRAYVNGVLALQPIKSRQVAATIVALCDQIQWY